MAHKKVAVDEPKNNRTIKQFAYKAILRLLAGWNVFVYSGFSPMMML